MNPTTTARDQRTVPIKLLADLARVAGNTRAAQNRFYRSKSREHLNQAKDHERRLDKAIEEAITLYNAMPAMFPEGVPPARKPLPSAEDVILFLEFEREVIHTRPVETVEAHNDKALQVQLISDVIDLIDPDQGDGYEVEELEA